MPAVLPDAVAHLLQKVDPDAAVAAVEVDRDLLPLRLDAVDVVLVEVESLECVVDDSVVHKLLFFFFMLKIITFRESTSAYRT